MKKLYPIIVSLIVGLSLVSCKKEDINRRTNYVKYNGTAYDLDVSLATFTVYPCDETHCNVDFYLESDNEFIQVHLELYDLGTEEFSGGTFEMGTNNDPEAIPDYNFFEDDYIVVGENTYFPISGKVKVTKLSEENKWRIDFNYAYSSLRKASGNFIGVMTPTIGDLRIDKD